MEGENSLEKRKNVFKEGDAVASLRGEALGGDSPEGKGLDLFKGEP